MKLICFTIAGGNSSFYDQLKEELMPEIELIALEYAGHGSRCREPFYSDFAELANDMFAKMEEVLTEEEPYAILGYSMGSISTIEVLKIILQKQKKLPIHVFLAAHEPFTKESLHNYSNEEMDGLVKARTIQFGAVPERLINNRSFWRIYLPVYRADYSIIGKYRFESMDFNSAISTTIFYSESDTPYSDMKSWQKYFTGDCEFIEYSGNHFFIKEHYNEIAQVIKKRTMKYEV